MVVHTIKRSKKLFQSETSLSYKVRAHLTATILRLEWRVRRVKEGWGEWGHRKEHWVLLLVYGKG